MNVILEKPIYSGTYSIPSATLYVLATSSNSTKLHLSTKHLYRWTKDGLAGGYLTGIRNRKLFINYKDLISLRAISAMRTKGMKHRDIIKAENVLKEHFQCDYPFATYDFWTIPPKDIFVKENGILLSASRHLQSAMEFIAEYLQPYHNMTFDVFGLSASWKPHPNVLLDPQIQYGEPCIEGTRIPTQVIWSFNNAGDSVDDLAYFYGITKNRIEDALDWENHIQEVAHRRN
jgi:uncharacterized protein (DUF433 family)